MKWQEAAKKSRRGVAERFDILEIKPIFPKSDDAERKRLTVRVNRWEDGHTKAYSLERPARIFLDNLGPYSEGHDDWEPAPI